MKVTKRGPKREVKLVSGNLVVIATIAPPDPPIHALAVFLGVYLHWTTIEAHGKSTVWERHKAPSP